MAAEYKPYGVGCKEAEKEGWHICANSWDETYDLLELIEGYLDGPMARVDWVDPHGEGGWLLCNPEKGSRCIYIPSAYVLKMAGKPPVVETL